MVKQGWWVVLIVRLGSARLGSAGLGIGEMEILSLDCPGNLVQFTRSSRFHDSGLNRPGKLPER